MFKLVLEKTEEPEIKLPTFIGSLKKQESSRKTSTALLTTPKPLTVWITTNWKVLQDMGIPDYLTCLLRNLYAGQEAIVSISSSNFCFLTCIQISQEADQVVWYSDLFKNFPQFVVIHTVKGFSIINEADAFLELSCFFYDLTDVGNLLSGSSTFSKSQLAHLEVHDSCIVEA